jgi:hypothetical protein
MKGGDPCEAQRQSVSSTELRLGEIEDKAATRVTFWRLNHLDRFFGTPASTIHASVCDRRERAKGSRGWKQWISDGYRAGRLARRLAGG